MTEKRNIVIKVKLAGKSAENFEPKVVTEWNIKRIAIASATLILSLILLVYVISDGTDDGDTGNVAAIPQAEVNESEIKSLDIPKQTDQQFNTPVKPKKELNKSQTDDNKTKDVIKKQSVQKAAKEHEHTAVAAHNVVRASLTYEMNNKEPAGGTVHTVNANHKKPVWIYYFTELKAMNGDKVYHEWLKNGAVVSRQALVISGDTWRTSSRKLISDSEQGSWSVRLVDEKGRLLNEKKFKVE